MNKQITNRRERRTSGEGQRDNTPSRIAKHPRLGGKIKGAASGTKTEARVYSYIRFSTPEQAMGHSERRQAEDADAWCKRNGHQLDNKMVDRGLSGYHGHHRTKGHLGAFLREVEAGNIPSGSILLVENIDRLSREGGMAVLRNVIGKLWDNGITLQTLSPEETFEPWCDNHPKFIGLMFSIQRAQGESERKSDLITKARTRAFEAARSNLTIVTARCPVWLEVRDRKFHPIPEAVETIRWIYRMKADGLSQRRIERALNDGAAWRRPNGWRTSYIKKILSNPATIGEYQPHRRGADGQRRPEGPPIPGYYPAIIEPEVYYAVQAKLEANRGKGGRTGKRSNIFTHIVRCGYCGGPMRYMDKGETWQYLACDHAVRGVRCRRATVRYSEVVEVVLDGCVYLDPIQVLPSTDEHADRAAALRQRAVAAEDELQNIEQQIENFIDHIGRSTVQRLRDTYEARITDLEARATTLKANITEARRELAKLEHGPKSTRAWQRGVADLMDTIRDPEAADTRAKLAAHLRTFIDRIEIFPHGFATVADRAKHYHTELGELVPRRNGRRRQKPAKQWWDPNVDTIIETLDGALDDTPPPKPTAKRWDAFGRYVLNRRMSEEGRFYRVHFKTGERVDLVPPGGLATGYSTVEKTVKKTLPDIARLWRDFEEA